MDYTGKRIKIINLDGWLKNEENIGIDDYINRTGVIKRDYYSGHRFVISFDDRSFDNIDEENGRYCFREENIEIITENKPSLKPPLGVTPKYIYDGMRIQELTRALHDYAHYDINNMKVDLMMKWTQELYQLLEKKLLKKNKTL